MTSMQAAYLVKPGTFEVRKVERPEPKSDEVLISIKRTGICGTDLHMFHGHYATDSLPLIPGHEFCGCIESLGESVKGLNEGQSVVVDMNIGCNRCYWCRRNEILNCPEIRQIGISMDGAFAEFIAVPARLVIPVSDKIAHKELALAEPLSCVVRAARKAQVSFGQSVAVIGAGPIGNLHVQLLRTIGAAPIIVSDISKERLDVARNCGADIAVNSECIQEAVMEATDGRGVDIAIESVGKPELYDLAKNLIRRGGHITAFGLAGAGELLTLDILKTILEENSVKGSVAGMGQDLHDAVTLLTHDRINTEPFTGAEFPLGEIQTAFDTIVDRPNDLKTQIVM